MDTGLTEPAASTELDAYERPQEAAALLRTTDPVAVVDEATRIAQKLSDVLKSQKLTSSIRNKDYVRVEGWQTVGMMVGVTAACDATEAIEDHTGAKGWKAHARAIQISTGQVVGEADAICTRGEKKWAGSDDYAVLSMAQTRAISKVLRLVLAWIVTLAGYETTPAEEMEAFEGKMVMKGSETPTAEPVAQPTAKPKEETEALATPAQRRKIFAKANEAGLSEDQLRAIFQDIADTPHSDRIPKNQVDEVLAVIAEASGA
jgi:hypothetical protein